MDNFGANAKK